MNKPLEGEEKPSLPLGITLHIEDLEKKTVTARDSASPDVARDYVYKRGEWVSASQDAAEQYDDVTDYLNRVCPAGPHTGFHFLTEGEMDGIEERRRERVLHGFKRSLQEVVRGGEDGCTADKLLIRQNREQIAAVFREYGSARTARFAELLETFQDTDELLEDFKKRKKPEKQPAYLPGSYVFGENFSSAQVTAIRGRNPINRKLDNPRHISLAELFKIDNDGRPIFINIRVITPAVRTQLTVLVHLRPELAQRFLIVHWNYPSDIPSYEQYAQSDIAKTLSQQEQDAAGKLKEYVFHEPKIGEVYSGVVEMVGRSGLFVEILPGKMGFISDSDLPHGKTPEFYTEGDAITVEVIERENPYARRRNGGKDKIWLSAQRAEYLVRSGKSQLAFGGVDPRRLLA